MSSFAIVTVVTRNYLHYAQALALSVKEREPQTPVWVCLADDPGPNFSPPPEWDGWFLASDLGIPQWRRYAFQYTPFELSCALKPFVIEHLLKKGLEKVAYLDGDMQVCAPLDELRSWLDKASIVLTPHARQVTTELPDDHEELYLLAGAYNAGFLAVRKSEVSTCFLKWWQARHTKHCIHDLPGGKFVDQKWLDLVPGLFPEVHLTQHRGYNVGHWSLVAARNVAQNASGTVTVDSDPLAIFHFSGFVAERPELISHHSGCNVASFPALRSLCASYAQRLQACNKAKYSELKCEFAQLRDGTPINPVWREAIRTDHPLLAGIADPFDTQATPDLVARFQKTERELANNRQVWRIANLQRALRKAGKRSEAAVVQTSLDVPPLWKRVGKGLEQAVRSLRKKLRPAPSANAA